MHFLFEEEKKRTTLETVVWLAVQGQDFCKVKVNLCVK